MLEGTVAFLGPSGSYSDLALRNSLPGARSLECKSVAEIFERVQLGEVEAGIVPFENVIQGPVTETLDLLLKFRERIFIDQSFLQKIVHALGILPRSVEPSSNRDSLARISQAFPSRAGQESVKYESTQFLSGDSVLKHIEVDKDEQTRSLPAIGSRSRNKLEECGLEGIKEIHSHFQALSQCSDYLDKHCPNAARVPTSSTSKAVDRVVSEHLYEVAVIANAELLTKHGFIIIDDNISDVPDNQTRFMLIRKGNIAEKILSHNRLTNATANLVYEGTSTSYVTSVALNPGRDRQGLLHEVLTITSIKHQVNLLSIHSRPDAKGGFVFFLELEGHYRDSQISDCLKELEDFCHSSTGKTAEVIVFGSYLREPFFSLPFSTVGIIGGKGEMGRWFANFLKNSGLDVQIFDIDTTLELSSFVNSVQVVILSVPMSHIREIVQKIAPLIKPGQLIVENCSIKNSALPLLLELTSPEVEILGFHTMFGGRISSLRGENIIVTPTERSRSMAQAFEDLFYKYGANVHTSSLDEHDRVTAHTQSLVHLILISLGEVLSHSFTSEDQIAAFSTPNSRDVLSAMRRVLAQSDELISDLQLLNKESNTTRRRFLEAFFNLTFSLEHGKLEEIRSAASRGRKFLGN